MSDRHNLPLKLPPEREISPQLRARVLNRATREDRKPSRPPTRIGPVLAGLAAAAVVVGVVYAVSQDGNGNTPATSPNQPQVQVTDHDVVATVLKAVPDRKVQSVQHDCSEASGIEAGYRMTTQLLRSPVGRIKVGGYAEKGSSDHTQVFCTPFAIATSRPPTNMVSAETPVKLIADSRVQGLLPARNGGTAYYDGAWFAAMPGVDAIEVRLVVDGTPQTWHAAKRYHAFLFASAWAPLTEEQLGHEITVEYRAISVDQTLLPIPADVASTQLIPAETRRLPDRRTILPSGKG